MQKRCLWIICVVICSLVLEGVILFSGDEDQQMFWRVRPLPEDTHISWVDTDIAHSIARYDLYCSHRQISDI